MRYYCLELSREELLASPTMQTLREEVDSPTEQGEEWCQEEEVYWPIFYASFRIPKEDEKEEEKKEPRPLPTVPIKCCLWYECNHDNAAPLTLCQCPCP